MARVLTWSDLDYSVGITIRPSGFLKSAIYPAKKERKPVLKKLSGHVTTGEMCALMGPSGSGKSSLLSVLAGRLPGVGRIDGGGVTFNGTAPDKAFQRLCGFVFQDDLLMQALTVRETVEFAAKLRLPQELGDAARAEQVSSVLKQLSLEGAADTLIGSEKKRGVSGGERKRAAVAVELVARPPLLFMDEPTSGLDAATALLLVRALRGFAANGMLIISSIHQPRSNIFASFDSLCLLASGRTAYFGPVSDAVRYFEANSGLTLPPLTNPADWLLDIVDAESKSMHDSRKAPNGGGASGLADLWASQQATGKNGQAQLPEVEVKVVSKSEPNGNGTTKLDAAAVEVDVVSTTTTRRWRTSAWWQFRVLLARSSRQQRGDVFNAVNVFQILAVAVIAACLWSGSTAVQDIIGVLFFVNIQQSFNAQNTVLRIFPSERALMLRERGNGTYRMLPYFLAKSAGDLVAVFVLPVFYALIIYFSVRLRFEAASFFFYLLLSLTTVFTGQSLGLLVSIAVPDLALANCISFVFVLMIMLFGGFYVNVDRIPDWIAWIRYVSYMYWAFSGMVINEYGGRVLPCGSAASDSDYGGCPFNGDQVVAAMGFDAGNTVFRSWIILLSMALTFRLLAYLCLRFNLSVRV